jgi:Arc/MetJ-type ribon-helix-helix transcriptional regulator
MIIDVTLPPQLEAWLRNKVDRGQYHSAGDVVCEALLLALTFEAARPTFEANADARRQSIQHRETELPPSQLGTARRKRRQTN